MIVTNRVVYNTVDSNLVYPIEKGYYLIAKLDDKWVKDTLRRMFGRVVTEIHNKYVITVPVNNGQDILIYNHDGSYFLINK
jgi:hypothetical protein